MGAGDRPFGGSLGRTSSVGGLMSGFSVLGASRIRTGISLSSSSHLLSAASAVLRERNYRSQKGANV